MPVRKAPTIRAECLPGGSQYIRPCRYRSCRFWLRGGGCVLDVAIRTADGAPEPSYSEIAAWLGLSRESVRQAELAGLNKIAVGLQHGLQQKRLPEQQHKHQKESIEARNAVVLALIKRHPGLTLPEINARLTSLPGWRTVWGHDAWSALAGLLRRGVIRRHHSVDRHATQWFRT